MEVSHCNWTDQNMEHMEEELANTRLFKDYPEGLLYVAFVCCVFYMLVGIPGNFITIIALARCKKIHNATTAYIMNLACSDMLFCCSNLPMVSTMYWKRSWPYGNTVCRFFPLAGYGLVAVSLLTILAIMVNRYILIVQPRLYPKIYTARYIAVTIVGIWILSFGMLMPTWFDKWGHFGMDFAIGSCSILSDCNNRSPKRFLFVIAFLIPCLLILICYVRIFYIVRKSTKRCSTAVNQRNIQRQREVSKVVSFISPSASEECQGLEVNQTCRQKDILDLPPLILQPNKDEYDNKSPAKAKIRNQVRGYISNRIRQSLRRLKTTRQPRGIQPCSKDRKLLQMTVTIVVCFWVCYLPITFIKLFRDFNVPPEIRVLGYLLVYLTTCINPVIYVLMSSDYRQAYKSVFVFGDNRAIDSNNFRDQKQSEEQMRPERRSYVMTAV